MLETETGELAYCNAGHNPPLCYQRAGRSFVGLSSDGIALGVLPQITLPGQRIAVEVGDLLVLYTDGVTEATDRNDQLFSLPRLQDALEQSARASALRLIAGVTESIEQFVEGAPQSDDLAVLCIRYFGGG